MGYYDKIRMSQYESHCIDLHVHVYCIFNCAFRVAGNYRVLNCGNRIILWLHVTH